MHAAPALTHTLAEDMRLARDVFSPASDAAVERLRARLNVLTASERARVRELIRRWESAFDSQCAALEAIENGAGR